MILIFRSLKSFDFIPAFVRASWGKAAQRMSRITFRSLPQASFLYAMENPRSPFSFLFHLFSPQLFFRWENSLRRFARECGLSPMLSVLFSALANWDSRFSPPVEVDFVPFSLPFHIHKNRASCSQKTSSHLEDDQSFAGSSFFLVSRSTEAFFLLNRVSLT